MKRRREKRRVVMNGKEREGEVMWKIEREKGWQIGNENRSE